MGFGRKFLNGWRHKTRPPRKVLRKASLSCRMRSVLMGEAAVMGASYMMPARMGAAFMVLVRHSSHQPRL